MSSFFSTVVKQAEENSSFQPCHAVPLTIDRVSPATLTRFAAILENRRGKKLVRNIAQFSS